MPDFLGGLYYPLASALTASFNVTTAVQHNVDSRHLGGIQVTEEQLSSILLLTPTTQSGYATPTVGVHHDWHSRATSPEIPDPDSASNSLAASISSMNISSLHSSSSDDDDEKVLSDAEKTPKCIGVIVEWKPGSIWNTHPYHQHAE